MRMSFEIKGLGEASDNLRSIAASLSRDQVEAALLSGALIIEGEWKRRAPWRTGNYRRSISSRPVRSTKGPAVRVGTNISQPPYPIFLEFGTRRMAPRPSARVAFYAKREAARNEVAAALRKLAEGAVR